MKQTIQHCFLMVLLVCSGSAYGQPPTTDTDTESAPLALECSTVAPGGTMNQKSLELTVASLVLMASQGTLFGTSTSDATSEGAVQGVYYCRSNDLVTTAQCEACVLSAAEHLANCTTGNSAIAWFEECTVRAANFEISAVLQLEPFAVVQPNPDVATPDPSSEQTRIRDLHLKTLTEAAAEPTLHFAVNLLDFGEDMVYAVVAQCSPDISSSDCQTCLARAVEVTESPDSCPKCAAGPPVYVLLPSCQYAFGFVDSA